MPNDIRRPLDPNAEPDTSEFGWGAGIDVPGTEDKPPSEGGRYRGTTPDCGPVIGVSRR